MKHFTIVIAAVLFFIALTSGIPHAEVATPEEMDEVCLNWLSVIVYENGDWAGDVNPEIIAVEE
ncbi:MAG: hypothetical protein ABIA59_04840, partial [Candidatus Latescibacterota bacterium]